MNFAPSKTTVAYFSMEIALDRAIPTYSGGLGVLAGDTLRSAADLAVSMVGITLIHRKGYFEQHIDDAGNQTETPGRSGARRTSSRRSTPAPSVQIEGRTVHIRAWKYPVRGITGHEVPVYLLDTDAPGERRSRPRAHRLPVRRRQPLPPLSGGRARHGRRGCCFARSAVPAELYHLNEGHSALLTLCLLDWQLDGRKAFELDESRSRGGAKPVRVHDAHAGARGTRPLPARPRAARCSATTQLALLASRELHRRAARST